MNAITEQEYFAIQDDRTRMVVERTSYGPGTMTTGLYDEATSELLATREVTSEGTEYFQPQPTTVKGE